MFHVASCLLLTDLITGFALLHAPSSPLSDTVHTSLFNTPTFNVTFHTALSNTENQPVVQKIFDKTIKICIYQNNKWKIFLTFRYHYFLDSLRGVHITVSGAIKARQSNSLTLLYKNDLCSATMVWFLSSGIKYSGWQQFVKLENMKQPGENHNH